MAKQEKSLTYNQGVVDGEQDFQNGECENINHLAEVTNFSYACGYEVGWTQARDAYEKELMGR